MERRLVMLAVLAIVIVLLPRRTLRRRSPRTLDIENRICVAIVVPHDASGQVGRSVADSIRRLLLKSNEPSRISICVYDQGDSVRAHVPVQLQTFVKVARNMLLTEPMHSSDSDARAWVVRHMFRGERYFMTVPACVDVASGWDRTLIEILPSPKSILTAQCEPFSPRVNFLSLGSIQGSRLVLVNKPCIARPTNPVPSLFWVPSLSFAMSSTVAVSPPLCDGVVRSTFADATLNGICLWTHGYDFFTPHVNVVWAHGPRVEVPWQRVQPYRTGGDGAPIGAVRTTREYEAFAGIDLELKVAVRRAYAGLTPTYTVAEAMVKSGSVQSARIAVSSTDGRTGIR